MPTYEYACITCKHEFEANQSMADHEHALCPVCGNVAKQEIRTPTGFELKGEGWPGKKQKQYSTRRMK